MNLSAHQKRWPVLLTTMFASFMNPFMLASVNIALPDIQEAFTCNATTLSWVTNAFLLANAIVLLPLSKAADIWGRVRFFKLGLLVFTIFTLLAALSHSIYSLLLMRIFQGAGAAMMHVTALAILTETYPPEKRGVVLGINIGAVYAGLSLGPFIGGLLTQWLGWQGVFYMVAPLGLISLALAHFNLKIKHLKKGPAFFDVKGSMLYASAIFAFIYGGGQIKSLRGIILTAAGIILMLVFFRFEKTRINPIFSVSLIRNNRRFAFSNYAALIHYAATFGVGFLLSLYLQVAKGLSPRDAGLILVFQPVVMAISAPFTGRLSDKIEPGKIASLGMILTMFSLLGMMFLKVDTSLTYITTMLVVLGLGFGMFTSPNTNSIMSAVEKKDYGIASGMNATMRVFGQTLSMMVATLLISVFLGKNPVSAGNSGLFLQSMKIYFMAFTLLCVPGIWFSLQRGKVK